MGVRINSERKGVAIAWDDTSITPVTIVATGEAGDVHNKAPIPNVGEGGLFFPGDFTGDVEVEIQGPGGAVLDSGTITIG